MDRAYDRDDPDAGHGQYAVEGLHIAEDLAEPIEHPRSPYTLSALEKTSLIPKNSTVVMSLGGQGINGDSKAHFRSPNSYFPHDTIMRTLQTCLLSFAHKYLDRSGSPATTPLPTPQEEWVTLNSSVKSHTILKYPSSPQVFPGQQTRGIEPFS